MVQQIQPIPLSKLNFDSENPRLIEYTDANLSETALVKLLCDTMAIDEIILSIVKSGFFPNDPLIAIKDKKGTFTVIEGNRRLAALKVITDYDKYEKYYPAYLSKPSKTLIASLKEIPVFLESSREMAWQYIGFKHVNGPAKWSSYAKAQYIAKVHNEFGVSLEEIALQIGDSNKTVNKLYQALMVLDQAEKSKVYERDNIYNQKLYFSHLYTGLQYDGIKEFVGLKDLSDSDKPISPKKLKQLGELLTWIYGDKREETKPLITSQNPDLRNLDQVLRLDHSIQTLRSTNDLNAALESSLPDESKFFESLTNTKLDLYRALQYAATGYNGDIEKLKTAGSISEMAEELYNNMEAKHQKKSGKGKKARLTE